MAAGLGLEKTDTIAELMQSQLDASVNWDDIARLRERWKKPLLIVKGVLDPSHVAWALAVGVDGLVISNHGGRQLDGAVAPIDVLPDFAAEANGRLTLSDRQRFPLWLRHRTGAGARRQCRTDRPRDALCAGRRRGGAVFHALAMLKGELDVVQALMGAARIEDFHPGMIRPPAPHLISAPKTGASPAFSPSLFSVSSQG